ncbi:MAG: HAD family hydrolase [Chloroflexi bacterium]|nr:HAD family hydrolase [Chloroflexota bacterium]
MADRLRGVVFDLFGTLISTTADDVFDNRRLLAEDLGVDADVFERVRRETREPSETGRTGGPAETLAFFARQAGAEPRPGALRRASERWLAATRRWLDPEPSTLEALDGLRAAGYRLGLLTNCSSPVEPVWADSPLAARFDATAFSSEVGFLKPHPETYRIACQRLGLAPAECLYVGDGGDNELTGATAAGLHPVLIETMAKTDLAQLTLNHEGATWAGPRIQDLSQVAGLLST